MKYKYCYLAQRDDNGKWVKGRIGHPCAIKDGKEVSTYFHGVNEEDCWFSCKVHTDSICTEYIDKWKYLIAKSSESVEELLSSEEALSELTESERKKLLINSMEKVYLSFKTLYEENGEDLKLGGYIAKTDDGNSEYYDVYTQNDVFMGCDGEEFAIAEKTDSFVRLISASDIGSIYLTLDELETARFH